MDAFEKQRISDQMRADYMLKKFGVVETPQQIQRLAKRRGIVRIKSKPVPVGRSIVSKPIMTMAQLQDKQRALDLIKLKETYRLKLEREKAGKIAQKAAVAEANRIHNAKIKILQEEARQEQARKQEIKRVEREQFKAARVVPVVRAEIRKKVAKKAKLKLEKIQKFAKDIVPALVRPKGGIRYWYGFTGVN
jgi:hypothetical protein